MPELITPEQIEACRLRIEADRSFGTASVVEGDTLLAIIAAYQRLMSDVLALSDKLQVSVAEVDRLRTPPPPGELRGLDAMCAALHAAAETDPVVKEVAWRTFALIRAHREQSAEVDRLKAENAHLNREWQSRGAKVIRLDEELRQAKDRLWDVAKTRVWTNEDGKGFVFADDLRAALDGPAAEAVAE